MILFSRLSDRRYTRQLINYRRNGTAAAALGTSASRWKWDSIFPQGLSGITKFVTNEAGRFNSAVWFLRSAYAGGGCAIAHIAEKHSPVSGVHALLKFFFPSRAAPHRCEGKILSARMNIQRVAINKIMQPVLA